MPALSEAEKELLIRKHVRASQLRAEFNKEISDPYRHATGEGGTVMDRGLLRFQAMRVNYYEHFRPTGKAFAVGMCTVVLPILGFAYLLKHERDGREHKYRTGQVAYKDRNFKFI